MIECPVRDGKRRLWYQLLLGLSFGHHEGPLIHFLLLPQIWMNRQDRHLPLPRSKPRHRKVGRAGLIDPKREARIGTQSLPAGNAERVERCRPGKPRHAIMSLWWLWYGGVSLGCWCCCNTWVPIADMAAIPCSRNIVIVFPFICGDHRFQIMRCPLHMLSNCATCVCTLVVAPVVGKSY